MLVAEAEQRLEPLEGAAISGTCIMLQATMSRRDAGPNAARYRRRISARASVGSCASGSSIATNRPSGRACQSAVSWWCRTCARTRAPRQARRASTPVSPCSRSRYASASAVVTGPRGERAHRRREALRDGRLVREVRLAERRPEERVVTPRDEVQRLPHHGRLDDGGARELALERLAPEARGARPDADVRRRRPLRLHPDQALDHRRRREPLPLQQELTRERRAVQLAKREDALGHAPTLHTSRFASGSSRDHDTTVAMLADVPPARNRGTANTGHDARAARRTGGPSARRMGVACASVRG